jgi:anti-sigma B factor antagonist
MSDFTQHEPRPGVLALSGDLTVGGAQELKALLMKFVTENENPEIDLLNVAQIDTTGVQLLLLARREATHAGKSLKWLGFSLAVEDILELLNLSDLLGRPAAVVWS